MARRPLEASRDGPARGHGSGAEAARLARCASAPAHSLLDAGDGELDGGGLGGCEKARMLARNTARPSLAASDGGPPPGRGGGAVMARSLRGALRLIRTATAGASDGGHGGADMASRAAKNAAHRSLAVFFIFSF